MAVSLWFQNVWRNQVPSEVLQPYMISLDERIEPSKEKGRGAYGAVFEVKYNGTVCIGKRILDILVGLGGHQFVDEDQYIPLIEKFRQECDLMSKMRHPNVVQFLGIYQPSPDPRDLTLVMEKLHIDLGRFIEKHQNIPLSIKLSILRDVSSGLLHIHSHGVIHRDLNAGNILLTEQLCAKVADFGMSRVLPQNISSSARAIRGSMTIMPGAIDYMPPEAVEGEYDQKLDTFSFGHITLYLINEEYPQPVYMNWKKVGEIKDGIEIERRRTWLKKMGQQHCLYDLIVACLQDEPEERPTMLALNTNLNEFCSAYPYKLEDFIKISCPQIVNTDLADQLKKEYQTAVKEFIEKLPGIDLKVVSDGDKSRENEEVDQLKAQLTTMTNAKEELESQVTAITTSKKEVEVQLALVTNEKEELQSQVTELLQAQMDHKDEHQKELRDVRDSMSAEIVHMEQVLCQMNDDNLTKVHQYEETIEQLHQDIEKLRNTEKSLEELNLTVRNLESRNSALESQCILLERQKLQNIQVVEDRKELKERLQQIEERYQKTLQEKIQLEKDLQYNVNQQLLSHKVLETKPKPSDREHIELSTRNDMTGLKTNPERMQINSTVLISKDKTIPLGLGTSNDHELLKSNLTNELPDMAKEDNTLNPEERREDPLLSSPTRYTPILGPAKPTPPPRGYYPQNVGIDFLPVAIETEDDEQPLTSLGAKLLKRRQKIESAHENPIPNIISTENVCQRAHWPATQTTDDITKEDGAKMKLERPLALGISDDHQLLWSNLTNEFPGMVTEDNTLNPEERREDPLLSSPTRYTPIPGPAKPTPPPRGYNPQKVGICLLPVATETEDDEQPLTSLGAKLLKRRQKIESAREHFIPDLTSTEDIIPKTPRPASQTIDDITKRDSAKTKLRRSKTLGRQPSVANKPVSILHLDEKDDELQAILERRRKRAETLK